MFYNTGEFDFVDALARSVEVMGEEVSQQAAALCPESDQAETSVWLYRGLHFDAVAEARARLPETTLYLESISGLLRARLRFLAPHARLKPRREGGFLRGLVLLSSASGCALSVAGETRRWSSGQCFVMNPDCVHEIWNDGTGSQCLLEVDLDPSRLARPLEEYVAYRSWRAWLREPFQYARYLLARRASRRGLWLEEKKGSP